MVMKFVAIPPAILIFMAALALAIPGLTQAQPVAKPGSAPAVDPAVTAIWRNPDRPASERVTALMSQLTPTEKISLLYFLAPAIPRLGIRAYDHGDECLHGLVRPGNNTVFPQAIALGATFDPALVQQMAAAISDEARARWNAAGGEHLGKYSDVLTVWSPVVNMARDPRWGRTQETYGEDPWLTSCLGVAFVRGIQGNDPHYLKVIATPKHFAGYDQEAGRFGNNIVCDQRYLMEYDLMPFRACIMEGEAESIMSSYTSINGVPSSANQWLLTDLLRNRWGFQGYVVSDCGAVSHVVDAYHYVKTPEAAIAACLNAGLDMEGGLFAKYPDVVNEYLPGALTQGLVQPEVLETALRRVLTGRFRLGMYDPTNRVPYSSIPMTVVGSPPHIALARKLAGEAIVLLKNAPVHSDPLLPINPAKVKTIALVGPNASMDNFGDYSGKPTESVTVQVGLEERARRSGVMVKTYLWQSGDEEVVPEDVLQLAAGGNQAGLKGEYFSSADLVGQPEATRVDRQLDFNWAHTEPDPLASGQTFGVRWTGQLLAKQAGDYTFIVKADGGYRLFIDDQLVINRWFDENATRKAASGEVSSLSAGAHTVKLEYHHHGGETGLVFRWRPPVNQGYIKSLKDADLVVALMGISDQYESEGRDRNSLNLPVAQAAFINTVAGVNPHLVLVLESGSPIAAPWAYDHLPAILQAWYPGEEGGHALADILFGDVNPSGRLPLTFYANDSQLRPMNEYDLTRGRTYMYLREKPSYPFGYGLSYTSFRYANLKLSKTTVSTNDIVTVSVDVTNTGKRTGDEVVQCYVHARQASVPMPIKQLWAFQRLSLAAGQTQTVSLIVDTKNFSYWDQARQQFIVEPGLFDILVGGSSDNIQAAGILTVAESPASHH